MGALALALLLIGTGCWFWWLYDETDLAEVRRLAAANHIPVPGAEVRRPVNPHRVAIWNRLVALEKRLPAYVDLKPAVGRPFKSFLPIPEEMRAHHAHCDQTALAETMVALDELGDQALVLHGQVDFQTKIPEIATYRGLMHLLRERSSLADSAEATRLCRRQLALCQTVDGTCLISYLVRLSLTQIALDSITDQLKEFAAGEQALVEPLLSACVRLLDDLPVAMAGELQCSYVMCAERAFPDYSAWYLPPIVRLGRRELLTCQIGGIVALRSGAAEPALAWASALEAELSAIRSHRPDPFTILKGSFMPSTAMVITMAHEVALKGRLLAAELGRQPWPIDVFDPGKRPLRELRRDGFLLGAYSVDKDGVDDGGDGKKDHFFPLYGTLKALPSSKP